MATRPALTAEEVLESVLNDSDQDSDQEYTEPDLDFDVPMADGSDDEFSDLDEQEESVHVTRKLPVSSMEQQSLQGHSSASLSPRSDNYNPELVQTMPYVRILPESPSEIFSLFFTPTIMSNIVEESNKYAKQMMGEEKYAKWTPITERELKAYFGFCILMGIVSLPSLDDYWKKDPLLNYSPISSRISRDRFRDIRRYIHFNDNDQIPAAGTPGRDRLAKIRPLLEALTKRCLDLYDPHKNVAVDEAMIKFQGRSTIKQ